MVISKNVGRGTIGKGVSFTIQDVIVMADMSRRIAKLISEHESMPSRASKIVLMQKNLDDSIEMLRAAQIFMSKISGDVKGLDESFESLYVSSVK